MKKMCPKFYRMCHDLLAQSNMSTTTTLGAQIKQLLLTSGRCSEVINVESYMYMGPQKWWPLLIGSCFPEVVVSSRLTAFESLLTTFNSSDIL